MRTDQNCQDEYKHRINRKTCLFYELVLVRIRVRRPTSRSVSQPLLQRFPSQSPVLLLLAFGPRTRLPFLRVLVTFLLPLCDSLPRPDFFLLTGLSPVAEPLSDRASPTLTFALICMLSPRSFERRATSLPTNPVVREMYTSSTLARRRAMSSSRGWRPRSWGRSERSARLRKRSERSTVAAASPPVLAPAPAHCPLELLVEEARSLWSYPRLFSGFDSTS